MKQTITFTDTCGIDDQYKPQPSSALLPNWYKETESYIGGEKKLNSDSQSTGTIKRCMPVFDAICSGYILVTHVDIFVTQKENLLLNKKEPYFEWASQNAISLHKAQQAPLHPLATGSPIPKWNNPWAIKTPAGYSTLFVQPFHRDLPFTAMPGVVDTDKYSAPVNIIFALTNPNFEGLVPAGTPIIQVIPFKRTNWNSNFGNQKDFEEQSKVTKKLISRFFDSYKNQFRSHKEYR